MTTFKKIILILAIITFTFSKGYSQELIQNEKFTYAPIYNNKVVFIKEIPLINPDMETNFHNLKEWGKLNYSTDVMISSIRYDNKNKEIIVKSKIELILPPNHAGIKEQVLMVYRLNAFLFEKKCVLEIKSITYNYNNKNSKVPQKNFKAEELITENALQIKDNLQEFRINTQKSTLYFLNGLANELSKVLNQ